MLRRNSFQAFSTTFGIFCFFYFKKRSFADATAFSNHIAAVPRRCNTAERSPVPLRTAVLPVMATNERRIFLNLYLSYTQTFQQHSLLLISTHQKSMRLRAEENWCFFLLYHQRNVPRSTYLSTFKVIVSSLIRMGHFKKKEPTAGFLLQHKPPPISFNFIHADSNSG